MNKKELYIKQLYDFKVRRRKEYIKNLKDTIDRVDKNNDCMDLYTLQSQINEINHLTTEINLLKNIDNLTYSKI